MTDWSTLTVPELIEALAQRFPDSVVVHAGVAAYRALDQGSDAPGSSPVGLPVEERPELGTHEIAFVDADGRRLVGIEILDADADAAGSAS
jgi:hypothetical protein